MGKPESIAIDADDYHAEFVGRTAEGKQYFLTAPFEPATPQSDGCEYVALFLFNDQGDLLEAEIESFGPRESMDNEKRVACRDRLLNSLGKITHERIEVKPFCVRRFDCDFGLIAREPEDEDDEWAVELHPGNYMAFFEPWDSGIYDT